MMVKTRIKETKILLKVMEEMGLVNLNEEGFDLTKEGDELGEAIMHEVEKGCPKCGGKLKGLELLECEGCGDRMSLAKLLIGEKTKEDIRIEKEREQIMAAIMAAVLGGRIKYEKL